MKRATALLGFLCCAAGLVLICTVIQLWATDSPRLPFWDHWLFVRQLANQHGHYFVHELWQQHNEHRIVLLRLLLLADFHWFGATGNFLAALILIIHFCHLLVFFRIVFWIENINSALRVALCGLVTILFFSLGQSDNFVSQWQLCFILAAFLQTFCFYLFARALGRLGHSEPLPPSVDARSFSGCLATAFLATINVASGLFVWPVLVYLCFIYRLKRKGIAALLVGAIVTGAYLVNFHSPGTHANPLTSLYQPMLLARYLVLYLGAGWAPFGTLSCTMIGSIALIAALAMLWDVSFRTSLMSRAELFSSAIAAFTLITGLITGLGRINFGVDQAVSSRYQTFVMVFWAAVAIWSISKAAKSTARDWAAPAVFCVLLVIAAGPLLKFRSAIEFNDERARRWRLAESGALSDVYDRLSMRRISMDVAQDKPALNYLRANRLSAFSGFQYSQLGLPLSRFYQTEKDLVCDGSVTSLGFLQEPRTSSAVLSGWAWDSVSRSGIQELVLADDRGDISGFGTGGFVDSTAPAVAGNNTRVQWFGFTSIRPGTRKVLAYGVISDGTKVCPIGTPQDVSRAVQPYEARVHLLLHTTPGVFRDGNWRFEPKGALFLPDASRTSMFGQAGDIPVVGDWDGKGKLRIGVFRNGKWLMDMNSDQRWEPAADKESILGQPGDIPIVGDWNGTGELHTGVFRGGQWWLDIDGDGKWTPEHDTVFLFGQPGDIPVVGDWDGTGRLRIGIFRGGVWWLDVDGDRKWILGRDDLLSFGRPGDQPVVGDWDQSGKLKLGVFRNGEWLLDTNDNGNWDPGVDEKITFGMPGDLTSVFQWPIQERPQ